MKTLEEKEQEFVKEGYVIFEKLYSQTELFILANLTQSLINMAKGIDYPYDENIHKINYHGTQFVLQNKENNTVIHRMVWVSGAQPELLTISRAPKLLDVIAKLLQANQADHLVNSIHPKLPNSSVEFKVHQDEFHRKNFDPDWININDDRSYVVCITAIDFMSAENGGIYLIPFSHKIGKVLSGLELNELNLDEAIAPTLNPGDTLCMNQKLIHYSLSNESQLSRNILINGFSVVGANHAQYPGEGSAQLIELTNNTLHNFHSDEN